MRCCGIYVFIYKENEMSRFVKGILIGFLIGMIITGCSDSMLMADYDDYDYNQLGSSPYNPMYVKIVN